MKSCAFAARAAASICASVNRPGGAVRDVVAHRVVEENRLLAHDAGERAQRRELDLARVDAVEGDAAVGRLVEARNQIHQRALPRPARADQRDDLAAPRDEADVAQHRARRRRRSETFSNAIDSRSAVDARAAIELRLGGLVEHLEQALGGGERLLRGRRRLRELLERRQQPHHQDHEGDQRRGVHQLDPLSTSLRADPEDQHRDRRADDSGDRLRQRTRCA